jgi:hypothetical protein
MWFLMFVVCFTTDCEQQAYPKPFKTEAECQLSIAEIRAAIKRELLKAESLSCIEAEFSLI